MTRCSYHGWMIELIPQQHGFAFHCWLPNGMIGVSDRKTYPNSNAALQAAQSRADLETVHLALKHCQTTFQQGFLEREEYLTLSDLILSAL